MNICTRKNDICKKSCSAYDECNILNTNYPKTPENTAIAHTIIANGVYVLINAPKLTNFPKKNIHTPIFTMSYVECRSEFGKKEEISNDVMKC